MRKLLLLAGSMLLLSASLLAQNRTITGKILDPEGKPIPNATVLVKGSKTGTSSQTDGSFSITIPSATKTLVISAIGMTAQDVDVTGRAALTVSLATADKTLSEVVVTSLGIVRDKRSPGYATQRLGGPTGRQRFGQSRKRP
ncbi:carboxypeptidase-like regulatory domain-containing protein [Puia sp. P3]|uniref:carboxypeptidase-like regulatory domain-containing protein n=1 Tax=Puia sp. P3 TaxID=3423952 RepID=UPI003D6664CC